MRMPSLRVTGRIRRTCRGALPRTDARLLGLRKSQSGQGALEYVGLIVVVVAIVGALLATNMGPQIADQFKVAACKITGGDNCGTGADDQADGSTGGGDQPSGTNGGQPKSQAQIDYDKALKDLQDAQKVEKDAGDKAKDAAKELAKILAEELGIKDAFDCITKGDMGACTETLINILTSLIGGAVGKLAAKYGAPWKWKKAVELIKKIKKHGGDLYDGIKDLIKNRKKVKEAQQKLDDAKKKVDAEKKDKPDEKKPDDKPTTCPVRHSFLPGTPVLLSDGRRAAIEDVQVGDKVLATEPNTGRTEARLVEQAITTYTDKHFTTLTIRTAGGPAVLTVTDTHPFWLTDRAGWADAGDIQRGASLRSEKGEALPVIAVSRFTKRQVTHDLTVADIHTYYVVAAASGVLVHNNDGPASIPQVDNKDLQYIVDSLYKGIGNERIVGDGSAMAAASAEVNGAGPVENRNHVKKTEQMRNALNNFLTKDEKRVKGGKKVPVVRSARDVQVAKALMQAIDDGLAGKYKGYKNYPGLDC